MLVVGRGGGSAEDLWAFNDERVARALAESPVPTISAVGHETDLTIADLVADRRAPTPSAAAELAVPDRAALLRELATCRDRITRAARERHRSLGQELDALARGLTRGLGEYLSRRGREVEAFGKRLEALSPLAVLKRGYAVALDARGRVLRTIAAFEPGLRFTLRVEGGRVGARAEDVRRED